MEQKFDIQNESGESILKLTKRLLLDYDLKEIDNYGTMEIVNICNLLQVYLRERK